MLKEKIDAAIQEVIENSNFISGKQVKELEESLAEYVGVKHCITCGNGTDALSMVMSAWNIKPGDAVFVPDFTFFSTAEVVSFQGATPIFVDVDANTFNMNAVKLEKAIKRVIAKGVLTPKAVIPVDLYGLPANFPEIRKIVEKYELRILEDGAQGFGGKINAQKACSFGDVSTTSFFPAKPLGCYGDGGAIFTDDDNTAEYLRSIRVHGKGSFKYDNVRIGRNSRLDTLQAAILQVKLEALKNYELNDINMAAGYYTKNLKDTVITPPVPEGFYSSWAQYTIRLNNKQQRDGLQTFLKDQNIPSMVYYPKPLHKQKVYTNLPYDGSCQVTESLSDCVLSLPIHPYLTNDQIDIITDKIQSFLR